MGNIIKIDLELSVQEFDILGGVYKINYNDEGLKNLQKEAKKFYEKIEALNKLKPEKMSDKQEQEYEVAYSEAIEKMINSFFGHGSYVDLFEKSNRSSFVMLEIIAGVFGWIEEKFISTKKEKKNYYTKK